MLSHLGGLVAGSLSALNYAWLLMLLPQGVFAQAVATAAFPTFSAQAARGQRAAMRSTLAATLRAVLYLALPAAVGLIVLREPLVELIFQRGAFTGRSTQMVAWALGLFALTFVIYLSTLSPTVGEADSFEFQVVSHTLGIAHPTGYPLYILLGKLFTLLPIGNVAYRVNLISPLFASLAIVCLYLCLVRLTHHQATSLLAALTFAFSRTMWSQAVIAEVYTLNAFFVALVLYLLLKCTIRPTMKSPSGLAPRPRIGSLTGSCTGCMG